MQGSTVTWLDSRPDQPSVFTSSSFKLEILIWVFKPIKFNVRML